MKHLFKSKLSISTRVFVATAVVAALPGLAMAFGIQANGIIKNYGQPGHETLTYKAAIDSGILTDSQESEMKALIEGSRFNDDPEGHLLKRTGVLFFGANFLGKDKDQKIQDPTKATHFGNYQFLHAMGKGDLEYNEIKTKIMLYAAHCFAAISDPNSFRNMAEDYATVIKHEQELGLGVEEDENFRYTPRQLIIRRASLLFPQDVLFFHAQNQTEFQYRALGSLLHMIQDSYARGHVVRVGWEQGTNDGDIRYFQDYAQQDSKKHGHDDNHESGDVKGNKIFELPGAKMAYTRSKQLMTLVMNKCPWTNTQAMADEDERTQGPSGCFDSVFGFLNHTVFAFDKNTPIDQRGTRSHPDMMKK